MCEGVMLQVSQAPQSECRMKEAALRFVIKIWLPVFLNSLCWCLWICFKQKHTIQRHQCSEELMDLSGFKVPEIYEFTSVSAPTMGTMGYHAYQISVSVMFKLAVCCHINNSWRLEATLLPSMMLHNTQIFHWLLNIDRLQPSAYMFACSEHQHLYLNSLEVTWHMARSQNTGCSQWAKFFCSHSGALPDQLSQLCDTPKALLISRWGCLWPVRESPICPFCFVNEQHLKMLNGKLEFQQQCPHLWQVQVSYSLQGCSDFVLWTEEDTVTQHMYRDSDVIQVIRGNRPFFLYFHS